MSPETRYPELGEGTVTAAESVEDGRSEPSEPLDLDSISPEEYDVAWRALDEASRARREDLQRERDASGEQSSMWVVENSPERLVTIRYSGDESPVEVVELSEAESDELLSIDLELDDDDVTFVFEEGGPSHRFLAVSTPLEIDVSAGPMQLPDPLMGPFSSSDSQASSRAPSSSVSGLDDSNLGVAADGNAMIDESHLEAALSLPSVPTLQWSDILRDDEGRQSDL